jgi:hypothetical protein
VCFFTLLPVIKLTKDLLLMMIANLIYVSLIMTLISLDLCQWSLVSLITGNKVKKHTSQGIKNDSREDIY